MSGSVVDGACLCGAVRMKLTLPVKWVAHCHCSMCRRAHGAAYVTWVGLKEEQLEVVGAANVCSYASSADASREHCKVCGTPLFFRGKKWPGEVHVARALVGDVEKEPQAHVFFADKVPWITIHDELPKKSGLSGS